MTFATRFSVMRLTMPGLWESSKRCHRWRTARCRSLPQWFHASPDVDAFLGNDLAHLVEQADFVSDLHDDFFGWFCFMIGLLFGQRPTARAVRARRIAPVVGGRDHGKKRGETLLDKRSSTASAQEPFVRLEVVLDQIVVPVGSLDFEVSARDHSAILST